MKVVVLVYLGHVLPAEGKEFCLTGGCVLWCRIFPPEHVPPRTFPPGRWHPGRFPLPVFAIPGRPPSLYCYM